MNESNPKTKKINPALKYAGIGTELLAILGLGVWGGYTLDQKWSVLPLFTLLLPLIGLIYSFRKLWLTLQQDEKSKKSKL